MPERTVVPPAATVATPPTTTASPATPAPQGEPAAPATPSVGGASPAVGVPAQGEPVDLGDAGKRAIQSERAARQKAEQDLAALQKQIADANKSAEEKAADALREAQDLAAESAAKALRYEVAAEVGVPLAMASRLVGKDRAEILADAETFLAQIPQSATVTGPKPDPAQGPRPQSPKAAEDAEYEQFKAKLFPDHNTERA